MCKFYQIASNSLQVIQIVHELFDCPSYIAPGRADNPLGTNFLCQQDHHHFGHLLQVSKKSLLSLILYIFFKLLCMYVAPGQGQTVPQGTNFWCQQKCLVTSFICCKLKKNVFEVWFYTFFYDFIHVCSPEAGADSPQGTNFWCQQKCLVTSFICCKFQRNLFEVWF